MFSQLSTLSSVTPTAYSTDPDFRAESNDSLKSIGKLTLSTLGATSVTSTSLNVVACNADVDETKLMENKSLNTYIESMSDKELEKALIKYNLLESDNSIKRITK